MTSVDRVDVLAFGPHPDDLEIGLGGTLARHAAEGHRVGLCDLTRGELASNGTPEERIAEAESAGKVLGAAWRQNLGLPDRGIGAARSRVSWPRPTGRTGTRTTPRPPRS
jgi:LmbE family N-acetylglucosaminyl deacetylase